MRKPLAQGALAKKPIEFPRNKQMDSSVGELGGKIGAILKFPVNRWRPEILVSISSSSSKAQKE